jgi:predicted nucleic acid-binding protein
MGSAVLHPEEALNVWSLLAADERFFEITVIPSQTDRFFRMNVLGRSPSPKIWTDAWIASLAEASALEVVTFDQDFKKFQLTSLGLLEV